MDCPHIQSLALKKPSPDQSVYREDCTRCFDSIDDPAGLDVCLQCFNGGCAGDRQHAKLHNTQRGHPLALNIRRTRKIKVQEREEPPQKISKLEILPETEEDRYDKTYTVVCHECNIREECDIDSLDTSSDSAAKLKDVIEGVTKASTFARKAEIFSVGGELELCPGMHPLLLQLDSPRKIELPTLRVCSHPDCDITQNLWLCLQCGNVGCGREQKGVSAGKSHALAHAHPAGLPEPLHPVSVKLGSLASEEPADVYCYACDAECVDPMLDEHLDHWGIKRADLQKTEQSLTEMQIEQNLTWQFSMTTENGENLKPLFGPGLTGLKNLGNSCYLASILQCLYDMPSFHKRYYEIDTPLPDVSDPAQDLETQLRKVGDGLLSGRYSKPNPEEPTAEIKYQKGLAPNMLKHLVGRNHEDFGTMKQQDASQLYQHLLDLIREDHVKKLSDQGELSSGLQFDPTESFRYLQEEKLQCNNCHKLRYTSTENNSFFLSVPRTKLPPKEVVGDEKRVDEYEPVTLKQCLNATTELELVQRTCSCGGNTATKRTLFRTFPDVLVVVAGKVLLTGVKVDVPIIVEDDAFLLDNFLSAGQQPGEELLPDGPERDPNVDTLLQLGSFTEPQIKKALRVENGDVNQAATWLFMNMEDPGDLDAGDAPGAKDAGKQDVAAVGSSTLPARFQLQSIVCHKGPSIESGHYVAFIRNKLGDKDAWVQFNDEKVVEGADVAEMRKFAYMYFFKRV